MAMDFSGEYRIPARMEQVWEALNDPSVLRMCIAGCKQLDKNSDTEFSAVVVAKVGPVSATFRGNVVLSDLDPPNGYKLTGQGQGGAAGFASMSAQVSLADDGDHTLLRYVAKAEIGGKLASVGSRLVQAVAKKHAFKLNVPVKEMKKAHLDVVLYGDSEQIQIKYQTSGGHTNRWDTKYEGVIPNLERRYKETDLTAAKPGGDTNYEWRVKRRSGSGDRE